MFKLLMPSKSPRSQADQTFVGVLDKQVWSMELPPDNLKDHLYDLVLDITAHLFKPCGVHALISQRELQNSRQMVVMLADQCIIHKL